MKVLTALTVLCLSQVHCVLSSKGENVNDPRDFDSVYPVGDARWCIERARKTNFDLKRFEVLPGIGWDNLRNVEAGMVVTFNFTQCKVTDDGRLLIPDNVFTVPIKSSSVNSFAEVIDSWTNHSSTTSHTVNVQAGLNLVKFAASGSFSFEHTHLKSKQVEDKAVTVRAQLRYSRYEAKLQPDPELAPGFKSRLLELAANIELNNTNQARYDSQLLIRDYGTHYLTSVTAGAALVKDDYMTKEFVGQSDETKTKITATASANLFHVFSISTTYGYSSDVLDKKSYDKQVKSSFIKTHGGPLLGTNGSSESWIKGMDPNLVPIDRAGEPLYFLITERMLPEVPRGTVAQLEKIVRETVELYYEMNTIRGCTKWNSPNFSFSANFDDGSCTQKATNMSFGGVYQTCSVSGSYDTADKNPCLGLDSVNPLTGQHSCPPSYRAVHLHTEKVTKTDSRRSCHRCWLIAHCCHTDQLRATGTYSSYWCAADKPVPENSGYLFGGLYTKKQENPVTGNHACPTGYYARLLFTDLHVCISDDFEQDAALSVPFAGFFSCEYGNPLSTGPIKPADANKMLKDTGRPSLGAFMASNTHGEDKSARKCPDGYSQRVATITHSGCAIHYCVLSNFLSGPLTPPVKRPPFIDPPALPVVPDDNLLIFDPDTQLWLKNEKAREYQTVLMEKMNIATPVGKSGEASLSNGATAGLSVVATLCCVALATAVVVVVQRRRNKSRRSYRRLVEEPFDARTSYGTSGQESSEVPQAVVSQQT